MDELIIKEVNGYLVDIFNEIMMIEEYSLKHSDFSDLTIKEMHTIEAIGLGAKYTNSQVAQKLGITQGTLSVAIQTLVRKGYVIRVPQENDRRVVILSLSKKGKLLYRLHRKFHVDMVKEALNGMDEQEASVLIQGLRNLHTHLGNIKKMM